MISKRFDVGVQFISPHSSNPTEIVYFETVRRNSGAPLIVTHNTMLIPVRVEGSLAGAIRVIDISHLSALELGRIKQTIDLALEENFVSQSLPYIDEMLEQIASNVIQFPKATNDDLVIAQ